MQVKYIQVLTVILVLCSCTSKHAPQIAQQEPMKIECQAKCTVHVPMPGSKPMIVRETNGYDMGIAIANGLVNIADEGLLGYAFWTLKEIASAIKSNVTTTTTTTTDNHSLATQETVENSYNNEETTTYDNDTETTSTATTTSDDDTTTTTSNVEYDNDTTTTTYDTDTTTTTTTTYAPPP